jgi:hypothetical protein
MQLLLPALDPAGLKPPSGGFTALFIIALEAPKGDDPELKLGTESKSSRTLLRLCSERASLTRNRRNFCNEI